MDKGCFALILLIGIILCSCSNEGTYNDYSCVNTLCSWNESSFKYAQYNCYRDSESASIFNKQKIYEMCMESKGWKRTR